MTDEKRKIVAEVRSANDRAIRYVRETLLSFQLKQMLLCQTPGKRKTEPAANFP